MQTQIQTHMRREGEKGRKEEEEKEREREREKEIRSICQKKGHSLYEGSKTQDPTTTQCTATNKNEWKSDENMNHNMNHRKYEPSPGEKVSQQKQTCSDRAISLVDRGLNVLL